MSVLRWDSAWVVSELIHQIKTMCQQTDWLLVLNCVWTGPDVLEIDKTEPNIWFDCKYVNIEESWGWNRDKVQRWETKGRVRWREMMGELPKWEEDCRCIKLVKTLTQNYDWWEFKNEKNKNKRKLKKKNPKKHTFLAFQLQTDTSHNQVTHCGMCKVRRQLKCFAVSYQKTSAKLEFKQQDQVNWFHSCEEGVTEGGLTEEAASMALTAAWNTFFGRRRLVVPLSTMLLS